MSTIQDPRSNWEPAHRLRKTVSGAEIAADPCLPALSLTYVSAPRKEGPMCSRLALLSYLLNLLSCEHARSHRVTIEPFTGRSFFNFFGLSGVPRFGLLAHINSLRLSSGIFRPGLCPLRTNGAALPAQPSHALVVDASVWASPLAVRLGTYAMIFYFFPVMLSSDPKNSPLTCL